MESNPENILPEFQYNTNPSGYSPTPTHHTKIKTTLPVSDQGHIYTPECLCSDEALYIWYILDLMLWKVELVLKKITQRVHPTCTLHVSE